MRQSSGPRRGVVQVNGATLGYIIEGTGTPMLVIGSAVYYPRTFSRRLRESCRLIFADMRHFAETDLSFDVNSISLDTYMDDIDKVRDALGLEQFVVAGHSHHGNLALEYAKRYPRRISHLVLIGTPPCGVQRTIDAGQHYWAAHASENRKAALRCNRQMLSSDNLAAMKPDEAFVAEYVADGAKYWHDPNYDASWLWRDVPVNMDIIEVFRGFFTDYEFSWDPLHVRVPVLAIIGRDDYAVPHLLWDAALPELRNVTYHLFERSGHTPQLEEQELFDRTLLEWLRKESVAGS